MNENLRWILSLSVPAIITIVGNLLFYLWIKRRVDKSIEEHKISYSGIFKEKIDIYRTILEKSYKLKIKINRYYYSGNQLDAKEIFPEVEDFIHFYLMNQPFLSENMVDKLKKIREEFQFILDRSYEYHSVSNVSGIEPQIRNEIHKKFIEVGNRMKKSNTFNDLEELIIKEMREDLKTDK